MDFEMYQVGKANKNLIGNERVMFDINDGGGLLYVLFDSPTPEEIRQFDEDIDIRYAKVGSVFMMLFKFGSLNWVDAPYSPHLSKFGTLEDPEDGQGLSVQIIFADSRTGIVHSLRMVGLSTQFTRCLFSDIAEELKKPFDQQLYGIDVSAVFNSYTTDDLVTMANASCTIRRNADV